MAFDAESAERFHNQGRDITTNIARAMDAFVSYARVFEERGGALGMGEEYGDATLEIIYLHNDLKVFFETGSHQGTMDKYRTDFG